ncbi:hypothetical protein FRB90_006961 [Tulasnella sp. 427]|nr:hypothetical protein FRB90_006961 [Tulasnella sp. 427]
MALIKVVAALKLDAKVATCASASDALKLAIRAYVQSCMGASPGLLAGALMVRLPTLLVAVDAWIATGFGAAAGLRSLNLKAATDVTVCKSIVAFLLGLNTKFDFFASIKLNPATCYHLLSAVVIAN